MKAGPLSRFFSFVHMPWWFVLTLLLLLAGTLLIDFNGLYGQDSHAYLDYAKRLRVEWKTGTPAGPFFWPKGYPGAGALLSCCPGFDPLTALRVISFFSLVGSLIFANRLIRLLSGRDGWLFLWIGAVVQIYFVRAGFLVMSDMTAACCIIAAFYCYFRLRISGDALSFMFLCLLSLLAVLMRYASLPLLCVPVVHGVFLFLRSASVIRKIMVLTAGLSLISVIVLYNNRFLVESLHYFDHWSLKNAFLLVFEGRDGLTGQTVPNVLYIFGNALHIGFLSFGILLLPFYRHIRGNYLFLAVCLIPYLIFLVGIPVQNYRFLVVTHLPVLVVLFPAFLALHQKTGERLRWFLPAILVFNAAFGWYSFSKTLYAHRIELEVVKELKPILHNEPIYAFYVDQSFPSYGINNEVRNFFTREYRIFDRGAIVVFNETRFSRQWQNHRVMRNWKRLAATRKLDTLAVLTDQWIIYRVR